MSATLTPTQLRQLGPEARDNWRVEASEHVARQCLAAIRTGTHPGVVGVTNPRAAARVAAEISTADRHAWTGTGIDAWRDRSIQAVDQFLFEAERAFSPNDAAAVGLGLCDIRVRDVIVLDLITATAQQRGDAGRRLWPIAETLPDALRAPTGTLVAITEYTAGRDVAAILDWATAATDDYRLAGLLRQLSTCDVPPAAWIAGMSTLSRDECRLGPNGTAQTSDPLTPDPLAADNADTGVPNFGENPQR